jgi:hypothetical protein
MPNPAESFCEDISQLVVSANVIDIDHSILNALSNVVIASINVFTPIVVHWVLAQLYG